MDVMARWQLLMLLGAAVVGQAAGADPTCATGIAKAPCCCPTSCGVCGGTSCQNHKGAPSATARFKIASSCVTGRFTKCVTGSVHCAESLKIGQTRETLKETIAIVQLHHCSQKENPLTHAWCRWP